MPVESTEKDVGSEIPTYGDKPRSCATCASRKVKCDKQYPCSRCRRAGISCIRPSVDCRPQWARNMIAKAGTAASTHLGTPKKVLDRLRLLEGLVKDLSTELEQAKANAASQPTSVSHPGVASSNPRPTFETPTASNAAPQSGRIVLDDSNHVRYVTSGFWSRIDHELDNLKATDGPEDLNNMNAEDANADRPEQPHSVEAGRETLDRYTFMLRQEPRYDMSSLLPMASQIPFLLEIYAERLHFIISLPHMPTLRKLLQQRRAGRIESLSPEDEALVLSCFYATICSMDDDEVTTSFNMSKNDLCLRYRAGLEQALAKADFLNNPSSTLIQALVIFLALARRHESPKYVWMMTGLVIRMAHFLGIHRDGADSKRLTPLQVEIHRRIWWNVIVLDMRVTEDLGTEPAILHGSFTTQAPSNINDVDISQETKQVPLERSGLTDATFLRLCSETSRSLQEMMAATTSMTIEDHDRRLNELKQRYEREYFAHANESQYDVYLAAAGTLAVFLARMTLLAFPPMLYTSPETDISVEIRTKLLVAALEVIEHNHALNSEPRCHPWKWVYQTQSHWHSVIYLLIEICRRQWSPMMERAWMALQSPWLVPARAPTDKNFSVWAPLRKLMARARKHRENWILRLRADPEGASRIEREDREQIPMPSSSNLFSMYFEPEKFHDRWRQLIYPAATTSNNTSASGSQGATSLGAQNGSSSGPNHLQNMATLSANNQQQSIALPNSGILSSATDRWLGTTVDLIDYTNLDSFLGADMEMELLDGFDADLNFDWNSWFESAKNIL